MVDIRHDFVSAQPDDPAYPEEVQPTHWNAGHVITGLGIYVQDDDPGAVGAGTLWIDTTTPGPPWHIAIRNAADDGWDDIFKEYVGTSDFTISGAEGTTGVAGGGVSLSGGTGDAEATSGAFIGVSGGDVGSGGSGFLRAGSASLTGGEVNVLPGTDAAYGGATMVGGGSDAGARVEVTGRLGADGGDIYLTPGEANGGHSGYVYVFRIPTSDPLIEGALFSDGTPSPDDPKPIFISGGTV